MTRRSALAMAGGLVAALVAGLAALSINLGIVQAAGTSKGPGTLGDRAVVRTIERTVHRRAPAQEGEPAVKTVVIPRAPSTFGGQTTTTGGYEDGESDHGFGENDDD